MVEGNGPSLLGRDWLQTFRIQWCQIHLVVAPPTTNSKVMALLEDFPEVFNDNLGKVRPFKAKLVLKEGVQPVFCRPAHVKRRRGGE